jgi:hypothetical protein
MRGERKRVKRVKRGISERIKREEVRRRNRRTSPSLLRN